MIDQKTSILVTQQLPEFVRDNTDYDKFTLFVKAYYEWLESADAANSAVTSTENAYGQGALYASKKLLDYKDIDTTIDGFIEYFTNDFLPYFPQDVLIDKKEAIKFARELYQKKGTLSSYKFLFRVLYNSDFDMFNTKDVVLKASDGKWYISKSLKLSSSDENFLAAQNLRVFGETTKSLATIENAVLNGSKIEVFISDMERTFQSGEFIRVVDLNLQDVYFKDGVIVDSTVGGAETLRAKVVGQISSVNIDPNYRGKDYVTGDPVVVYGGLSSSTGVGASAVVNKTRTGSLQSISVDKGGYGYSYFPNTFITFSIETNGANAVVGSFNTDGRSNVAMIPIDTIGFKKDITIGSSNYNFVNVASANANTKLLNAFTFTSLETFPISSVLVKSGGSGMAQSPIVHALGGYQSDLSSNVTNTPLLSSLGILAPIQINSGGTGYQNNDTIIFTGGSGFGAHANVTVDSDGVINHIEYVNDPQRLYPLGGVNYRATDLPTLTVNSANTQASGADLYVPGILGEGATFGAETDTAGQIISIKLTQSGEDYIETPNVSLKVQDILVSNVYSTNLPQKGDIVIQGSSLEDYTYYSTVDSVQPLRLNNDPSKSLYSLRVFNYKSPKLDKTQQLNILGRNIYLNMDGKAYAANTFNMFNSFYRGSPAFDVNGVKTYGQGDAKATAKFLNGLAISEGQYLDTHGQPSSFSVLQNENYNNFTYQITVEKEISKYRKILLDLLHPSGTKLIGRYALKSNSNMNYIATDAAYQAKPLYYYTGTSAYVTMTSDFNNKSNNIIKFNDLPLTDPPTQLSDFLDAQVTSITLSPTYGPNVAAKIISFDNTSNTAVIDANTWLTFANVAIATAEAGSNVINITAYTGQYDLINNGDYYHPTNKIQDIVFAGDSISLNDEIKVVKSVGDGTITLTTDMTDDANTYLSVKRNFIANTRINSDQIRIYGPVGVAYSPFLITEDDILITTENGEILIVG